MRKFGAFLGRKTAVPDNALEFAPPAATQTDGRAADNPLELDEELFSAIGAQIGGENEALRSLLLDANAKVGELDIIKDAVGRLVDPVSKALRAIEAERSEKAALQGTLNNTRTAYGKLRNEAAELEKTLAATQQQCGDLRLDLANTQNLLRTAEATRAEIAIDIAARRAQIADLEAQLAQEIGESKALRDENNHLDERLTAADKRESSRSNLISTTRVSAC
jgi:chromosome segregation ATPase